MSLIFNLQKVTEDLLTEAEHIVNNMNALGFYQKILPKIESFDYGKHCLRKEIKLEIVKNRILHSPGNFRSLNI